MIYRKDYVDKIMVYKDAPLVKILTGVRRSGKSTILQMIIDELIKQGIYKNNILKYNFDSLLYSDMDAISVFNELKSKLNPNGKTYLFLDEIQEIEDWEKIVNSLLSEYDVDMYITGSNSRMMSSEISTHLTGRYISFKIYPLSFKEYIDFKKEYGTVDNTHSELVRYLKYGGFPALHLKEYTTEEAYKIVKDIYNSTIFTDIVRRNNFRKIDQLERIVKYVFSNVGNTFSASTISKYLKNEHRSMDNETIYNYLTKLEKAYIIHRCSRYDIKGKEYLKTQEKFYLADPALKYCVLGYTSDSANAMLENIVYLELLRRDYDVCIGKLDNYEIDFIATKNNSKLYIQVAKEITSEETRNREYGRLLSIKDNYPKYVLLADEYAGGNYEGIQTIHIADFLLDSSI